MQDGVYLVLEPALCGATWQRLANSWYSRSLAASGVQN